MIEDNTSDRNEEQQSGSESPILRELVQILPHVFETFSSEGQETLLLDFFKLQAHRKLPVQNIAFLLWCEVVKWFNCSSSTEMRYSEATKKFWKLGYRLFGGRFIRFMSGFKSSNQLIKSETSRGNYDTQISDINFAVPDVKLLRDFQPYDIEVEKCESEPGILHDMVEKMAKVMEGKSCCITFDGKKLKPGLTKSGGDVDLMGFENGPTLLEKKIKLELLKQPITLYQSDIKRDDSRDIMSMSDEEKVELKEKLTKAHQQISENILDAMEMKRKKEYAKDKMIKQSEGDWRNGKYVYGISAMIAFIHEVEDFIRRALEIIDEITLCISILNGQKLVTGNKINLEKCKDYLAIDEHEIEPNTDTRKVKQRSEHWFEKRKQAKVTGSTLYKAVGLDGLQRQKEHFDEVICGMEYSKSVETIKAMEYGTVNEVNAAATFVSKILPLLFPEHQFCEEGFIEMDVTNHPFMIISPDGSVKHNNECIAGIELKCPVSSIHHKMPPRYLLQCLSEIEALDVETLIYVSWKPDISTVFKVKRNKELFNEAYHIAKQLNPNENPRRPTKLLEDSKQLKTRIEDACKSSEYVEFLGIVSSVVSDKCAENVYKNDTILVRRVILLFDLLLELYDKFYELKREKASEAVVFLCCDLDRNWDSNSIRCVPVGWLTKGYSLDTSTMRNILEHILNVCKQSNLHVPAISFDGQWHGIAVRDLKGKPMTILQLEKDVWRFVESLSKSTILNAVKSLNTERNWYIKWVQMGEETDADQWRTVTAFRKIIVSTNDNNIVPQLSLRVKDYRLKENSVIGNKKKLQKTTSDIEPGTSEDEIIEINLCLQQASAAQVPIDFSDNKMCDSNIDTSTDLETEENKEHNLNTDEAATLLSIFRTDTKCNNKSQWNKKTPLDVRELFLTEKSLRTLRDIELKLVVRHLKALKRVKINERETKGNKIYKLCEYFNITRKTVNSNGQRKSQKPQNVKRLSDIAYNQVGKTFRKVDLNIIYAEYIWYRTLRDWYNNFPIDESFPDFIRTQRQSKPDFEDITEGKNVDHQSSHVNNKMCDLSEQFFYAPSTSAERNQIEVYCVDSSHLLTRIRRKICKGGIEGLTNAAWKKVAKSKKTNLSLGMIDCILDPMSVPVALSHISESVETEMRSNNDIKEADLCRDIRNWWQAEDNPGICAKERIILRMSLRNRLLQCHTAGHFPPPGMYVSGWPVQLWEALISNIDSKILLYYLSKTKTYNVRAFSSMMGETFFSELTLFDRRGQGTVTSPEFGRFIIDTVEKIHTRLDPERVFTYRTSRKPVYQLHVVDKYDVHSNSKTTNAKEDGSTSKNRILDHPFDSTDRLRLKSKPKEETIKCNLNAVQRGALGVRWERARRNESKLLLTTRLGIEIEDK